jgi:hypothetical protein
VIEHHHIGVAIAEEHTGRVDGVSIARQPKLKRPSCGLHLVRVGDGSGQDENHPKAGSSWLVPDCCVKDRGVVPHDGIIQSLRNAQAMIDIDRYYVGREEMLGIPIARHLRTVGESSLD